MNLFQITVAVALLLCFAALTYMVVFVMTRPPSPKRVTDRPWRKFDQWTCETCRRVWVLTFDERTGSLETPHTMREMANHKCKGAAR